MDEAAAATALAGLQGSVGSVMRPRLPLRRPWAAAGPPAMVEVPQQQFNSHVSYDEHGNRILADPHDLNRHDDDDDEVSQLSQTNANAGRRRNDENIPPNLPPPKKRKAPRKKPMPKNRLMKHFPLRRKHRGNGSGKSVGGRRNNFRPSRKSPRPPSPARSVAASVARSTVSRATHETTSHYNTPHPHGTYPPPPHYPPPYYPTPYPYGHYGHPPPPPPPPASHGGYL